MKLMDRDRETLRWVNGHGCVLTMQLAKERQVGYRNGARRVAALCKAGLLARVDLSISKLRPLVCTPLGCKAAGDSLAPLGGIRIGTLEHDLRVVDVARMLTRKYGGTTHRLVRCLTHKERHSPDAQFSTLRRRAPRERSFILRYRACCILRRQAALHGLFSTIARRSQIRPKLRSLLP